MAKSVFETTDFSGKSPKATGPTTYRGSWKGGATNSGNQGVGSGNKGVNISKSGKI